MARNFWIFKRGDRFTFAFADDPNDKSHRKQVTLPKEIKTEREAYRYGELHEDELKSAKPRTKSSSADKTIAETIERWVKLRENDERYAGSTFVDAATNLRTWVAKPVGSGDGAVNLGSRRPEQIDAPLLRKWVRALIAAKGKHGKPLAPYTIRNILRALTWLLDDTIGEGWATIPGGNPARAKAVHAELPEMAPLAGKSQKLRITDTALAQQLLDCPRVRLAWRVRYALDFTSGLRDGELSGLRVRDIDRAEAIARVRKALQLKSRAGHATIGKTKTRDSDRNAPLHPAAIAALSEWLDEGWEVHVGRPPEPDDFVFVKRNGKPWRPRSAERFREHAELAGLPTHVDGHPLTFHALRRSFVSWLRQAKVPQEARQVLMGHVPRTAEERHYSEEDPAALAEFVGRIRLVWNRVEPAPDGDVDERMSRQKRLHVGDRMVKHRRDFEG